MLNRLKSLNKDIRIGIVGAGTMGKGLLYQSTITPGIRCVSICDIRPDKAAASVKSLGLDQSVKVYEDPGAVAAGKDVDVLIEASDSIIGGGEHAEVSLRSGKHVIMMNSEADLAFGPQLLQLAEKNGVVYSSCGGDQHTVLKRMIDEIRLWGFELVMAGNIKGYLDRYADPDSIIPEADKRNLSYHMCAAMTDGTKLNVEMALLANALDLCVKKPGMYGPRAKHVQEVFSLFDFVALWEDRKPFVDYILGAEPGGGVFVVGFCENPYQGSMLRYYKMGEGPFYLFYKPYHLCHVEAMLTVARAYLDRTAVLKPDHGFKTNVYAYAKRDLCSGERLDGVGGYTCYGLVDNNNDQLLPICLSAGARLKRDIKKDEKIDLRDAEMEPL